MFRLEYLKLENHPQLGNIELQFSENNTTKNITKPFTTVIIGPNGTGKSYILRTIADIFRLFQTYAHTEKKDFNLPFDMHLRYKIYHNTYEIITQNLRAVERTGALRREYRYFKNRPENASFQDDKFPYEKQSGFDVLHSELEFPEILLVNSIMTNDRFLWKNSNPQDFYQYLGVRSTSGSSSTQSSSRRTVKHVFGAVQTNNVFIQNLKDLLHFLEFEQSFKINYHTKITKLFFSGSLELSNFKQYYEYWWDDNFKYSARKKENPLWSVPYYNNNFKDNDALSIKLINYLNKISLEQGTLQHKKNSESKIITVDLFEKTYSEEDIQMIRHLENLDIINIDGIKINKSNSSLSIQDLSSGEYHLLITLIGIFASIEKDSLILIDEPEISLHPNWQMRYISFLKDVFAKYASCQFIITTHSHFLVSDLEGKSSAVIALIKDPETNEVEAQRLADIDTFGWSAEQVLLDVFNVPTTRNYYVADRVGEILDLISMPDKNINLIKEKVLSLKDNGILNLNDIDPLKDVITLLIKKYA